MKAGVPLVGAAVIGIGVQENPGRVVEHLALAIAGPAPSTSAILVATMLAVGLASWAAPRFTSGSDGWIRHLPLSRTQLRVGAILATTCAEAPLLVAAWGAAVVASWKTGAIAWRGFLVPPVMAIAAAALAVEFGPTRSRSAPVSPWRTPFTIEDRIALRAIGSRAIGAWIAGSIPVGAALLFVRNNALPPSLGSIGTRLGGALAVTFTLSQLADVLAVRRPSWPWERSLPSSARRRVAKDAVLLGVLCAPVIAAVAYLDPIAAVTVLALTAFLSFRAAGAMRRGGE